MNHTTHRSLAAMILAGSLSVSAQAQEVQAQAAAESAGTLGTVVVRGDRDRLGAQGKDSVRATESTIGKGKQKIKDIPQSVTVMTEKLLDDRHLDTVKEALKTTAGITFLAAEGGEEDVRLRGFSLAQTGDIYVDGMRDPAFYDRDNFNLDRLEVIRGSASMLFGRGSTGGAINQVSKLPRLMDENEVDVTLGSWNYKRATLDVNKAVGESTAVRVTGMYTKADNNGSGSSIDKEGVAASVRTGIGEEHEFLASLYYLKNKNGLNYGLPWLSTGPNPTDRGVLTGLKGSANFGMVSDYNHGEAAHFTLGHVWKPDNQTEINTRIRKGSYERDMRASTIRLAGAAAQPNGVAVNSGNFGPDTVFTRGAPMKIQDLDNLMLQSDLSKKFELAGMKHELLAGFEWQKDEKEVFAARTAAQGGVDLAKPGGTFGQPNRAWINEGSRVLRTSNDYNSHNWGAYVQDMLHVNEQFKVVGGLRYDKLNGTYRTYAASADPSIPQAMTQYKMKLGAWSPRLGAMYQPNELQSWYASIGKSFNPSSEAYSLSAANVDTPPEKSRNIEIGLKGDAATGHFSYRASIFHSTKYNERNTDPLLFGSDGVTPITALTGERHTTGLELELAGRINPAWEVFTSWMWMPSAKVDKAAPCPATGSCSQATVGERPGDRPALTPKLSGTAWSTYQLNDQWRVGAGLNFTGKQNPTRAAFSVPSHTTVDLMAEFRPSESWTVKTNVSNVGNKYYASELYPGHYVPGAARNVQVTASYAF